MLKFQGFKISSRSKSIQKSIMLKKVINIFKALYKGKLIYFKRLNISKRWIGNDYGGFYIHPNYINSNSIIYSIGIGEDISFDLDIIEKFHCNVYGFDPTPRSVDFVEKGNAPSKFIFNSIGVADSSGVREFYLPINESHVSGSLLKTPIVSDDHKVLLKFKTLDDIMKSFKHVHIDILKIDIEGFEYLLIDYLFTNNIKINQLLIEFHPDLVEKGKSLTKESILKLNSLGLECFAVSDSFSEFSFINTKITANENS